MQSDRYIYDVLYGRIQLPSYVWHVLPCPELQRLREVRLCNVNSLCLTGGANINRYEHAIGTSYLALQCLRQWPALLSHETKRHIVLAALLHDIGSSAFGHSVQYVINRAGFEHESVGHLFAAVDSSVSFPYQHASLEPIYFGMTKRLHALLEQDDLVRIAELIAGNGEYGSLIAATLDLDNLDNVYRLAHHIGFSRDTQTPLQLAQSMWVDSGEVVIRRGAIPLIERWRDVRKRLYQFLLLNPDEFSAKCMLEQAVAECAEEQELMWHDVDYQLMDKIARTASSAVSFIAARLMVGNLYGCVGIYATGDTSCHDSLAPHSHRTDLERALSRALRESGVTTLSSAEARIHTIKDVGKTERRLTLRVDDGTQLSVGSNTNRVLIGVFLQNRHLSIDALPPDIVANPVVQRAVMKELSAFAGPVDSLRLYSEATCEPADAIHH